MTPDERERIGAALSAYLDGELSETDVRRVEEHLAADADARALLSDLRAARDSVRDLPRVAAPPELGERCRQMAERQALLGEASAQRTGRGWILLGRISASAALVAACVLAGWMVFEQVHWTDQSGPVAGKMPASPLTDDDIAEMLESYESEIHEGQQFAVAPPEEMEQLRSLGYVGAPEGLDKDTGAREPETLSMRDRTPVLTESDAGPGPEAAARPHAQPHEAVKDALRRIESLESLADERTPTIAAAERGAATYSGEQEQLAAFVEPRLRVVAVPENTEQYRSLLASVSRWQARPAAQRLEAGVPLAAKDLAQEWEIRIPPAHVAGLLTDLNEQAPQRVSASLDFQAGQVEVIGTLFAEVARDDLKLEQERVAGETSDLPQGGRGLRPAVRRSPGSVPPAFGRKSVEQAEPQRGRAAPSAGEQRRQRGLATSAPAALSTEQQSVPHGAATVASAPAGDAGSGPRPRAAGRREALGGLSQILEEIDADSHPMLRWLGQKIAGSAAGSSPQVSTAPTEARDTATARRSAAGGGPLATGPIRVQIAIHPPPEPATPESPQAIPPEGPSTTRPATAP